MNVTAIFDIGKTNKKFFLFDRNHQEVFKEYVRFEEIADEDGYPCDDLAAIVHWMQTTLQKAMNHPEWKVEAVNFSTYGASFVHIDRHGNPLTPLYNYLKPLPEEIRDSFYQKYGDEMGLSLETASPALDMLNSGFQLYWLKHTRPDIHRNIRWSLHFPQYLSYLFTGIPVSEYTSLGCHTALWHFEKADYHPWVLREDLEWKLPPLVPTDRHIGVQLHGQPIKVGVGIHDSSGALIPYLLADTKPFLLVSTGTWSIALNPFSEDRLTNKDLDQDGLYFMRMDGSPTKAARLFLGREHSHQLHELLKHFGMGKGVEKTIAFDQNMYDRLREQNDRCFRFEHIQLSRQQPADTHLDDLASFAEAYHQLMLELVILQEEACRRALGTTPINKLYIDGGFANNELFVHMLANRFPGVKIRTTHSPLGSALGAAVVISEEDIGKKFLKKNYALKKVKRNSDRMNQD